MLAAATTDEEAEEEDVDDNGLIAGAELIAGNSDCHGQIDPRLSPFFDAVLLSKLLLLQAPVVAPPFD